MHTRDKYLIVLFTLVSVSGIAQKIEVGYNAGIGVRSILILTGAYGTFRNPSFIGDRNSGGLGIHAGVKAESQFYGLEFYPILRYAVSHLYFINPADSNLPKGIVHKLFVDLNLNFYFKRKFFNYGIGYSLVNAGSGYYELDLDEPDYLSNEKTSTQYHAISALAIKSFGRFDLEAKLMFIPSTPIIEPRGNHHALNLRVSNSLSN